MYRYVVTTLSAIHCNEYKVLQCECNVVTTLSALRCCCNEYNVHCTMLSVLHCMLTEYNVTQLVHRLAISAMSTMQHNLHCNQCNALIVNIENPLQCLVWSPVIGRITV